MPKCIVHHDGWFFEWTTVSDGPASWGMRRPDFEEYYRDEYGRQGCEDLKERLDRAVRTGSSMRHPETSAESVVMINNAGFEESWLTLEQIVQIYCREQREPREGEGIRAPYEEDSDDEDASPAQS